MNGTLRALKLLRFVFERSDWFKGGRAQPFFQSEGVQLPSGRSLSGALPLREYSVDAGILLVDLVSLSANL